MIQTRLGGMRAIASLYPDHIPPHQGHPSCEQFEVVERPRLGRVVVSRTTFRAGCWLARFDGITVSYMTQHSLQKTQRLHIVDLYFAGLLAHACEPNVVLDMSRQNIHALKMIQPGTVLTIDYEATEDELFAPFVCGCGALTCRRIIAGRKVRAMS